MSEPKLPLYEGPVVDAHQHFWDPAVNDHPWLRPEASIPFRYGDYDAIRRRYLPPDYRSDARGQNVQQTVYVEPSGTRPTRLVKPVTQAAWRRKIGCRMRSWLKLGSTMPMRQRSFRRKQRFR